MKSAQEGRELALDEQRSRNFLREDAVMALDAAAEVNSYVGS